MLKKRLAKAGSLLWIGTIFLLLPLLPIFSPAYAAPATITIISPNGGESWALGSAQTIRWSYTGYPGPAVKIELIRGWGVNRIITASTSIGNLENGSYTWTVPSWQTLDTSYKIRITSTTTLSCSDTSDQAFSIGKASLPPPSNPPAGPNPAAPSVKVSDPNGGETWKLGTSQTIRWSFTGNPGSAVKIELLRGWGVSRVITSNTPIGSSGNGAYNWTVPSWQTLDKSYKIRITSISNGAYTDTSDNFFSITPPTPTLQVTSPNGGETIQAGTVQAIRWNYTANPGSTIKIDLVKGDVVFSTLASSTSIGSGGVGSFIWTVPFAQAPGEGYTIRLTSATNPACTDTSDRSFRITPAPSITIHSPNGGENWQAGMTSTIRWSYQGNPGSSVKIELLQGEGISQIISPGTNIGVDGNGSFVWTIPLAQRPSSDCKIKITSASHNVCADSSDSPFTISAAPTPSPIHPTQGIPPILYIFFDPPYYVPPAEAGPLGGWMWFDWKAINPEPSKFDWTPIHEYLNREAAKRVVLRDGQVIKKPIMISIMNIVDWNLLTIPDWLSSETGPFPVDRPQQPPDQPDLQCGECVYPPWWHEAFQQRWAEMVMEFGKEFNRDPRIDFIAIATGPYGEAIETMYNPHQGCRRYQTGLGFVEWVVGNPSDSQLSKQGAVHIYRKAFPNKPLFIINTGHGSRKALAQRALEVSPHVGIKFHSWFPDLPEQQLGGNGHAEVIAWYFQNCGNDCLFGLEYAYYHDRKQTYWAMLYLLAHRGTLADLSIRHIDALAKVGNPPLSDIPLNDAFPMAEFVESHLGRDVTSTPDVWLVLRDTIYQPPEETNPARFGEFGNWENYLYLIDGLSFEGVRCRSLPVDAQNQIYGCLDGGNRYSGRKTNTALAKPSMDFRIDHRWPAVQTKGFDIWITYLDGGTDSWDLEYRAQTGQRNRITVSKGNTGQYIRRKFSLPDADFSTPLEANYHLRIHCKDEGDEVIHMVQVVPHHWQAPSWDFSR